MQTVCGSYLSKGWKQCSLSFILNKIHLHYFPNSLLQLLTVSSRLCSVLLSHSVYIMRFWTTVMQASHSVMKQPFESNPVESHLCHWGKMTENGGIDNSLSWLVPFPRFSLYPGYLNNIFFLQEKGLIFSKRPKIISIFESQYWAFAIWTFYALQLQTSTPERKL